jgi:trans-feruloyl-CoA hydratase/vanillin synthase
MSGIENLKYPDCKYIELQIDAGVAWVTLNRPAVKNAFLPDMYLEIKDVVRTAEFDDSVDIIVFQGAGTDFSSGGDLYQVVEYLDRLDAGDVRAMYYYTDALPFEVVKRNTKVTVAKVHGWCAGGGMMLMTNCDIVVTADNAKFAVPEGRGGIADPLSFPFLTRRIGAAKANLLIYTGEAISGAEAERIGLASIAVAADGLDQAVEDLITKIRTTTPFARAHYKRYAASNDPIVPMVGPCMPLDAPDIHEKLRRWARPR